MNDQLRNTPEETDARANRIDAVMLDVLQRRLAGGDVPDEQIIAQHADLMPELGEELQLAADVRSDSVDVGHQKTDRHHVVAGAIRLRCPHCHQPVEVQSDTPFTDIRCGRCDGCFSLAGDAAETRSARTLKRLGHFELVERLGLGSFGTVWKARDTELDRTVAVKIPRQGQLEPSEVEMFFREARAAAQLNHKNIASVYEVGRENNTVYIVSELIRGVPLAAWLTGRQPTVRQAAELCATVSRALHHAHESGVIHRDLKPQNIMLDGNDEPFLMDFGLAKRNVGEVTMTLDGHVLGTPAYMSPEQARGEAYRADRRTDVYSLGVILFELLTGELPFRGNARMLIHQVLNEEAPSPRRLNNGIPRDLETVCLKCLQKQPTDRYGSTKELADELQRFLNGQPILARPISAGTRGWRWCKRNPVVATLSSLLAIVLVTLTVVGPLVAIRQNRLAQEKTLLAEQREVEIHTSTVTRLAAESRSTNNELPIRSVLLAVEAVERDRRNTSTVSPIAHEALLNATVSVGGTPLTLNGREAKWLSASRHGRWVATQEFDDSILLWDFGAENPLSAATRLIVSASDPSSTAFSADGGRFYVATNDGCLAEWNLDTLTRTPTRVYSHLGSMASFAVSSDGRWLAHVGDKGVLKLSDLHADTPHESTKLLHQPDVDNVTDSVAHVAAGHAAYADRFGRNYIDRSSRVWVSSDNRWVIARVSGEDQSLNLWSIDTNEPFGAPLSIRLDDPQEGICTSVELHPQQNQLFIGNQYGKLRRFDLNLDDPTKSSTVFLKEVGDQAVLQCAFSVDGRRLAAARYDLVVWDLANEVGHGSRRNLHEDSSTICVTMSSDGRWLASGGLDGKVKVWDLDADDPSRNHLVLAGHEQRVNRIWIDSAGQWVVSTALGGVPRVWDCRDPGASMSPFSIRTLADTHVDQRPRVCAANSRDGRWLAVGTETGTVRLWDMSSQHPRSVAHRLFHHTDAIYSVAISSDGSWLITGGSDGVKLSNLDNNLAARTMTMPVPNDEGRTVGISPDNRWAWFGGEDGAVHLLDLKNADTADAVKSFRDHRGKPEDSVASNDSRWLAMAYGDGQVYLWDLARPQPWSAPIHIRAHRQKINSITMPTSSHMLVTSSVDQTVKIWNLDAPKPKCTNTFRFSGPVYNVAISPNARWLAAHEYWTHKVILFDLYSDHVQENGVVLPAKHGAQSMAMSPDNRWLAIGTSKNLAMLWDLQDENIPATRRVLRGHQGRLWATSFSPTGDWLYTADDHGNLIMWPLELDDLLRLARRIAGRSLAAAERKQYGLTAD